MFAWFRARHTDKIMRDSGLIVGTIAYNRAVRKNTRRWTP